MDTACTVGIGDYRQLALGKQHCTEDYRYRHIICTLSRLMEDYIYHAACTACIELCIGLGIAKGDLHGYIGKGHCVGRQS